MKCKIFVLISISLFLSGCLERPDVSKVVHKDSDMIAIKDVYLFYSEQKTERFDEGEIGSLIGEVLFTIRWDINGGYKPKNGDATFLDVGTKIYSVQGYSDKELIYADGKLYVQYSLLPKR